MKEYDQINHFSELLKQYRFKNSLTQEELAEELSVSTMTIHRWEKGTNKPNSKEKISIQEFINDKGFFLDPYELLIKEIQNLQIKIGVFTDYLKRFHE